LARLVDVSSVKVVDMAALYSSGGKGANRVQGQFWRSGFNEGNGELKKNGSGGPVPLPQG
jgi:hypothetical protein